MDSFIGKRELDLGKVCQQLDDWIGSLGLLDHQVSLTISANTAAISIGDSVYWDDQSGEYCPSLDILKGAFREYMKKLADAMNDPAPEAAR